MHTDPRSRLGSLTGRPIGNPSFLGGFAHNNSTFAGECQVIDAVKLSMVDKTTHSCYGVSYRIPFGADRTGR